MKLPGLARPRAKTAGQAGEAFARDYLRKQGLAILETNYATRRGEIDIVADDDGTLVFVEVRLRGDSRYGHSAETIDLRKQRRLIRAAEQYLLERIKGPTPPCRFDAVAIEKGQSYRVEWLRDAFRPE